MTVASFIEDYSNVLSNHQITFYLWLVDTYGIGRLIPSTMIINESYIGKRHTQRVLVQLMECGLLERSRSGSHHMNYKIAERNVPMRLVS